MNVVLQFGKCYPGERNKVSNSDITKYVMQLYSVSKVPSDEPSCTFSSVARFMKLACLGI